jgi:hypothetical protein
MAALPTVTSSNVLTVTPTFLCLPMIGVFHAGRGYRVVNQIRSCFLLFEVPALGLKARFAVLLDSGWHL